MAHVAQSRRASLLTASKAPWAALVVDDDAGVRQSLRLCLEAAGARVLGVATGGAALEALDRGHFDVVFLDLWLGAEAGLDLLPRDAGAAAGSRRHRRHGVRVHRERRQRHQARRRRLRAEAVHARSGPAGRQSRRRSAAASAPPGGAPGGTGRKRRARVLRVSQPDVSQVPADRPPARPHRTPCCSCEARAARARTCWRAGFARTVRAPTRPFVTVNCPALSGDLMTSALFGHRKGAFTGAIADVAGKVQEAEGGTLLLDEVGELTPTRRRACCGSSTTGPTNDWARRASGRPTSGSSPPRIASSKTEVRAGRFREDLFYRLNVVTLTLPALRERPEDILPAGASLPVDLRPEAAPHRLDVLAGRRAGDARAPWPGNLRELRNAVERAVILAPRDVLDVADLGLSASASTSDVTGGPPCGARRRARLARRAGTRAHRARRGAVTVARSRGAHRSTSTRRRCSGSASDTGLIVKRADDSRASSSPIRRRGRACWCSRP